jgi:hypothetical protein
MLEKTGSPETRNRIAEQRQPPSLICMLCTAKWPEVRTASDFARNLIKTSWPRTPDMIGNDRAQLWNAALSAYIAKTCPQCCKFSAVSPGADLPE